MNQLNNNHSIVEIKHAFSIRVDHEEALVGVKPLVSQSEATTLY